MGGAPIGPNPIIEKIILIFSDYCSNLGLMFKPSLQVKRRSLINQTNLSCWEYDQIGDISTLLKSFNDFFRGQISSTRLVSEPEAIGDLREN